MKEIKRAIVLVDTYRRPSRKRNTAGRYIVSAKWILEEPHHACDRQNKRDLYLN